MNRSLITIAIIFALAPCARAQADGHVEVAERFLHGVYACGAEAVQELAGEDIVLSYPIFEAVLGTQSIRGRDAVVAFAKRFCSRWADAEITVHETVVQGNTVVIVWSYTARSIAPGPNGEPPTNEVTSWGGITLYRFDDEGKVILEVGEESDPGPFARISSGDKRK